MRRKFILLNVCVKATFRICVLTLVLICIAEWAYAQPIAGIKANGKFMKPGDTITVCIGGTVIHETTAQNFTWIDWRFNNGSPTSGISGYQPVTYNTAGIDTSWQVVRSSLGKDSTFILVLVADIKPVANFAFNPDGQCANIPINFNSTSSGTGLQYAWNFNDVGATSTLQNPSYQFLNAVGAPGTQTYNVKLIVTNEYQCKDSITKIVTVQNMPDASISNADPNVQFSMFNGVPTFKKCDILNGTNHAFQFQGASTTPGSISDYTIDWGDGSPTSTYATLNQGFIFSHTYSVGQYVMTVTANSNIAGGCIGVKKYNVFFGTTPAGGLIPLPNNSICAPNVLSFPVTGTSTNAESTTYTFTVNDGTNPVTYAHPTLPASISHLFTAGSCGNQSSNGTQSFSNSFRVTLAIENACGVTSSSVIPIYVSGKPKAAITSPVVACVGVPTAILNTSLMGGTITPTGGGNSTCTNNTRQVWTITPSTGFNMNGGSLGSFNGDQNNYLIWTSGSQALDVTFTQTGTYTIKLRVGNDCGYDEITRTICVRNAPSASFTVTNKIGCGPLTSNFTNTSPINTQCLGDSYSWEISYLDPSACAGSPNYNFLNGTNSNSASPQIQFVNPGVYVVNLNVIASGSTNCVAVATDTIKVLTKPKVIINPIGAVCLGVPVSPTAQVSNCYSNAAINLTWTFTNGSPSTSNQLVPGIINYSALGTHPLTLQATNECGITTANANVVITTSPTANAGPDQSICSGDTIVIGSTPFAGVSYQWTPTTGIVDPTSGNPLFSLTYNGPNTEATYSYVLTASAGPTCVKSDTVLITVKKKPVVTVAPLSTQVCQGVPVQLTASGADTYAWTPATRLSATTGSTVTATPNNSIVYTVIGTSANGCAAAANTTISVLPNPPANAGNDTTVCSFSPAIQLFATPSGGTWAGSPYLSATGEFDVPAAGNGVYNLTYSTVNGTCSRKDTVVVTVINTPVVNAGNDSTLCQDQIALQLYALPVGGRWTGSPFVTQNGVFNTSVPGTYTLIYTYGSGLCIGTDTVVYTVIPGISGNTIGSDQTICTGATPVALIGAAITGGNGTPVYQWQSSSNNFTWTNIQGANGKDFSPGVLTATTWYRRIASTTICSGSQANYSSSVKITVNPAAKAAFTPLATSGCAPFVISSSLINLTPYNMVNANYQWFVNGVFVGAGENFPGYTINNNNETATIMLIAVSAFGCKDDTVSHVFTAAGTPAVSAGADISICSGAAPFQLVGSPAGGSWSGNMFVSFGGLFNPSTAGTYQVIYTYGSGSCIGKDTMEIVVNAGLANNVIGTDQIICEGTIPAALIGQATTGGSGASVYQWQVSANNLFWTDIAGATGKDYAPAALSQTTWYRRVANSSLCSGNQASTSASVKITVNKNAKADFQPIITSGCPPFTITPSIVNLIPYTLNNSDYFWYVDGNFVGSGLLFPGYTIQNNNDSITVTLIAISASGCKNDTLKHGFIAAGTPTVNAGADTTICEGSAPFQLVASPAGGRWSGSPSVSINGLFNPFSAGSYTLVYTFGSGACLGTDTMVVTVSAGLSNNTISANQTICNGELAATLIGQNVTGGNSVPTYQWQSSANNIFWTDINGATGKDYTPGLLNQTTWFRRIANSNLCAGNTSAAIKVTVNPNAVALFSPNITSSCPPFEITPAIVNLIPSATVNEYQWYVDGNYLGSGFNFPSYTIQNNNDSVTIMLVAVSAFGCKNDSIQYGFKAAGTPNVNAGPDTSACSGSAPFQLVGSPAGGRWTGSPLVALNGVFNPTTTGTYTLVYTYGSGTCVGVDSMVVNVTAGISNNTIASAQTICIGATPSAIIGQSVTGGSGSPSYQWQSSTNNISWSDVAGATGKDYSPGALIQSTWFKRVATDGGCAGNTSAAIKITVNPNAIADFRPVVSSGCPPFTVTSSIINLIPYPSVSDYQWYVNGTFVGSGQVFPDYTIQNNNDSITVTLIAVSAFGCASDTLSHGFIASGTPSVNAGIDTSICSGSAPFLLSGAPAGGRWSGSPFVSINGLFNPATAGTYTLFYSVGSGACIGADTMIVTVSAGLSNNTIAADQIICTGILPATIVGQDVTGGNGNPSYQWQSSTNNISWSDVAGVTGKDYTPGALTQSTWFRRVATDGGCAGNTSAAIKITVNPNAIADFRPVVSSGCPPFTVTSSIINLISYASVSDYQWYVNGTFIGSGLVFPDYTIQNNNDSITVTLIAVSAFGCTNDTLSHGFKASGTPSVNAGIDTSICSGSAPFLLTGAPAGGRWTGSPFVAINGLFNPATAGTYTLVYSVGSGACIGADTMVVTVSAGLSNNTIAVDQTICTGALPATIIGQAVTGGNGNPVYQWQSSTNNISWSDVAGATGKDYTPGALTQSTWFRRVATDGGCAGNTSAVIKITVNPNATADFRPVVSSGCPPFTVTSSIINLISYPGVSDYQWYVNGTFVGSGLVFPDYTIQNNNDSITVTLIAVSAFGCANDTLSHGFIASGTPSVNAGVDTSICSGSAPFLLTGAPAGGRWTGSPFVAINGLFNPATAGTYTLIYSVGSGACIGADTMIVTVSAGLSNNSIAADQTICTGALPATIVGQAVTGGNGNPSYQWQSSTNNISWNDVIGATGKDYTPGALTQSTWFRRVATDGGCAGNTSAAIKITVNPNATALFSPSITSGCPPFTITPSIINLTTFNTVSQYRWYVDGNLVGTGENFPGITLANNGDSATIMLVAISQFGCTNDTLQYGFKAAGTPNVFAGPDTTFCEGSIPTQLQGAPIGGRWSGTNYVTVAGLFNPAAAGSYTLIYNFGSGACIGSDTMVVTVAPPIANNIIADSQIICVGTSASILNGQAITGGYGTPVYQWQQSSNNISWIDIAGATGINYDPGVLAKTTWFRRIANTSLCSGPQASTSNVIKITVTPDAEANFNPTVFSGCPPFIITPSVINLTPNNNAVSSYLWYANNNFIGTGEVFPGYTITNNNDSVKISLVLVSAYGCANDTTYHTFYATGTPGVSAGLDITACVGGAPFQLTGTPTGGRWTGSPFVSINGLFNPSVVGTFSLIYSFGSGACIGSDTMELVVNPGITNNVIAASHEICIGTTAATLVGQSITGGTGAPMYQWQMSINNVNWTNITGATSRDYDPGILTQTTWFRREASTALCSGAGSNFSASVKVTVNPNAKAEFAPLQTSSCPPFTITPSIINLTPFDAGNLSYQWFANDVQIGTGQTFPGYTIVNNLDSVKIKLVTISKFGCSSDTIEHSFYASGTPVVSAGTDTTICHLSFPIQLIGSPAGGKWSGNFITVAGVFNPSTVGVHELVYTYGSGTCVGKDTMLVNVSTGITNNVLSGNQIICINTAAATIVGQVVTGGTTSPEYQWESSTDGVSWNTIASATGKDYTPGVLSQTMWYRRIATTSVCNGLQASISAPTKVTINPDAQAVFNPTVNAGCVPFNITPSIINLTPFNSVVEYKWYVDGNYLGSGQSFPGYTMTNSNDSITIKLVAVSRFGCLNDSISHGFISAEAPSPSFTQSDSIGCGPLTISFTNTTPDALRYNFFWSFGNGQTSNLVQPGPVNFPVAVGGGDTVYTVNMSGFTSCDTFTVTRYVTVRSKPKVHFLPNKGEGCSPFTVTFTNLSSGSNSNYMWHLGDGTPPVSSNANSIQHTYTAGVRTTYQIKLVGTNDCGTDSFVNPIVVTPNAILVSLSAMEGDSVGCAPHIVRFVNNTTGANNFRWEFGDGDLLSTTNPRDTVYHTYTAPGLYNIKLKAIGNCNDTTVNFTVNIKVKPIIRFTATPMLACIGDTIRFTNTSDAGTESFWRFGDGTTSYSRNPVTVYKAPGTYRVKLFGTWNNVASSSCNDSAFVDIIIRDTMPGSFRVSDSVSSCIPFTVSFVNESGPSNNTVWNFGSGYTASGDSVVHTFTAIGTYTVKMATRNIGGCTFTDTKVIKVNAPSGTLMYDGGYACINEDVRFEVRNGNAAQYRFVFGDGDTLTTGNTIIFHKYTKPGIYIPHAYLLDGNCQIRISKGDTIKVDQIDAGFRNSSIRTCGVTTYQFTDTSTAYYGVKGWRWDFGDGNSAALKNPSKQYTSDGTYYVQLTVNGVSGCLDTVRIPINVSIRRAPVGDIGSDTIACTGIDMNFSALIQSQDSVVNVAWNFGNNTAAIGKNVSALYNVSGVYQVSLVTTTLYGCADTSLKTVRVDATPMVNAGPDVQICRGQSTPLKAFGASTYTWSPVQSLSCVTCPAPIANPLLPTQYVVNGKTLLGCSNTDTIVVNVIQPFQMTVSDNDTICIGETTQLFANGATRYLWNPVSGLSSGSVPNPIASPSSTTDYTVIGSDPYNCFADTGYVRVVVGPYPVVKLNSGGTVLVGSALALNSSISNGPIRSYTWTPDDDLSCSNCPRPIAVINKPITYKLEVENIYGCRASDTASYKVRCEEGLQVYIPNAFSPDGDGLNDVFMVRGKGLSAVKYFRVFNRWGQVIFERSNFAANDPRNGWDGRVNGVPANPDVYVYTAEITCAAGDTFIRKGNVTLVR